jgi:hypothetical protein
MKVLPEREFATENWEGTTRVEDQASYPTASRVRSSGRAAVHFPTGQLQPGFGSAELAGLGAAERRRLALMHDLAFQAVRSARP